MEGDRYTAGNRSGCFFYLSWVCLLNYLHQYIRELHTVSLFYVPFAATHYDLIHTQSGNRYSSLASQIPQRQACRFHMCRQGTPRRDLNFSIIANWP